MQNPYIPEVCVYLVGEIIQNISSFSKKKKISISSWDDLNVSTRKYRSYVWEERFTNPIELCIPMSDHVGTCFSLEYVSEAACLEEHSKNNCFIVSTLLVHITHIVGILEHHLLICSCVCNWFRTASQIMKECLRILHPNQITIEYLGHKDS